MLLCSMFILNMVQIALCTYVKVIPMSSKLLLFLSAQHGHQYSVLPLCRLLEVCQSDGC